MSNRELLNAYVDWKTESSDEATYAELEAEAETVMTMSAELTRRLTACGFLTEKEEAK